MPQKPLHTLELVENFIFRHQAVIGAAEAAGGLRDLFDAHCDVKPVQYVLGLWMEICRQFAYRVTTVGQKGDVLSWQHPLRLQHFVQSTLGFRIDPPRARKYLGRAFFRNTLTGNDLKTSGPTRSPLSTTDVAAIQTDRDGRSGFRRPFDLELASSIESELLGAQFSFESLGGLKHMGANGLAIQARIDGQHVMEEIGYRGKGQMRRFCRNNRWRLRDGALMSAIRKPGNKTDQRRTRLLRHGNRSAACGSCASFRCRQ